jgi:hypothetical protein
VKRPSNLTSKLKVSDPELKNYMLELEKENLKLQKQIAKFQVKDVSQQNQIIALKKAQPKIIVQVRDFAERNDTNKKIDYSLPT